MTDPHVFEPASVEDRPAYQLPLRWTFLTTAPPVLAHEMLGGYQVEIVAGNGEPVLEEALPWGTDDSVTNHPHSFLVAALRRVGGIRRIGISEREQNSQIVTHIWTFLASDDRDVRRRVYEVQEKLLDTFSDQLFDFHVHPDRPKIPTGDITIYYTAAG